MSIEFETKISLHLLVIIIFNICQKCKYHDFNTYFIANYVKWWCDIQNLFFLFQSHTCVCFLTFPEEVILNDL